MNFCRVQTAGQPAAFCLGLSEWSTLPGPASLPTCLLRGMGGGICAQPVVSPSGQRLGGYSNWGKSGKAGRLHRRGCGAQAGRNCAPMLCTCLARPLLTGDIRNLQTPGAHVFCLPWFHLPATFGEQHIRLHGSAASRGRLLARLGQRRGLKSHQRSPPGPCTILGC